LLLAAVQTLVASTNLYVPSLIKPPPVSREFRAAWVATVGNIDWPSKAGLTTQQQQAELVAILDRAVQLRLNAIILQVRPGCDALYASTLEPWSEYLTGHMGRAPAPFYDPLAFAIQQAHERGLELHAWFNPFRAHHSKALSPISPGHISKTRPGLVKSYGAQLWLDPGLQAVQDHSQQVILDVVRRYDLDGIHLDDYFYPYPENDARGQPLPFPDTTSWNSYRATGGKLSLDEWRRDNINRFIERLYKNVKAEKPLVKVGISPFGIWRPGFPEQIRGFDAYQKLYADSRKWLAEGWLDYFAPQLYWSIGPKEQSYPALLAWWAEQNAKHRHLWPGLAPNRIGPNRSVQEIINQIRLTRQQHEATGEILWSMTGLMKNRGGIADALLKDIYGQPALVPASPWLKTATLMAPKLIMESSLGGATRLRWELPGTETPWLWVLQTQLRAEWKTEILNRDQTSRTLPAGEARPAVIALTAIDRCGNAAPPAVFEFSERQQ
jgi:uncharacterized lipoprotein YddW (UPF0748 family)